jgi:hypothetical protein
MYDKDTQELIYRSGYNSELKKTRLHNAPYNADVENAEPIDDRTILLTWSNGDKTQEAI